MKTRNYRTRVAFTSEEFLACHCDCPSGSEGLNRHSCVHCLVKPYQLSLLLYDGLAENVLIELQIQLQSVSSVFLNPLEDRFEKAVKMLMYAAGGLCSSQLSSASSLFDMLNNFAMSTDVTKELLKPPHPEDLGLIRNQVYEKPETTAAKQIKKEPMNSTACLDQHTLQNLNAKDNMLDDYYYQI